MKCFVNYIGLRGCGTTPPPSGYYINSLTGISLAAMDGISNEEQLSYMGLWKDIQETAALRLGSDIKSKANRYVLAESLFTDTRFGHTPDPIIGLPSAAQYQGVYIDFGMLRYSTAYIANVGIYALAAGTMDLLIYDFATGVLLETLPQTLQAGYNQVEIGREYNPVSYPRRIFICYRGDQPLQLAQGASGIYDWGGNDCGCGDLGKCYGSAYAGYVADPNTVTRSSFVSYDGYALQVFFQIRCSLEPFICGIREPFKDAWANLLGFQIMTERLTSPRLNKYTTIKQDKIAELQAFYETRYEESLETAIDNLTFPADVCFPCNEQVSLRYGV